MPNFRLHINRGDDAPENWEYEAGTRHGALVTGARRMADYAPGDMAVVVDADGGIVGGQVLRGH